MTTNDLNPGSRASCCRMSCEENAKGMGEGSREVSTDPAGGMAPSAVPAVLRQQRMEAIARRVDEMLPVLAVKLIRFVRDFPDPDITLPKALLLYQLHHHGACTASMLAASMGLTAGPVTHLTKWLVARGFVERHPDPKDGRVVWFTLTDAGRVLVHRLSQHSIRRWAAVIGEIGEERAQLALDIMLETVAVLDRLQR